MIRRAVPLLALLALSCADVAGPGARCIADADCDDGLACYRVEATSSRRCLAACDPSVVVLCSEEAEGSAGLCAAIDGASSPGVCLLGGKVAPGEACGSSFECAASGICVVTDGEGVCERACDTGAPDCSVGEACSPLMVGGTRGYCAPGDGGV